MPRMRALVGIAGIASVGLAASGCNAGHDCGEGTTLVDGVCVASGAGCGPGTVERDGECVPDGSVICETGTTFDADSGTCVPDISGCAAGTVLVDGACVPEDDARAADVTEPPEPNDALLESDGFGELDAPARGEAVTIHGCIDPYRDVDVDGEQDADFDAYLFEVAEPTVVEITVDGVRGLAGAFQLFATDPRLGDDGWVRFGLNLVGDTSRQQAYLPVPGLYVLLIGDSRTILSDFAAGGPDACYFATVANVGVPAAVPITDVASGTLGHETQVFRYDPSSDGQVVESILEDASGSAAGAIVQVRNGAYAASTGFAGLGAPAELLLIGLDDADEVLLVVEPIANLALDEVPVSLTLRDRGAVADPGDGTPVALIHDEGRPNLLFFEGTAGDLVRFQLDPGATAYDMLLFPPGATSFAFEDGQWIADLCFECDAVDTWVQLQRTGLYYVQVINLDAGDGDRFPVAFTRTAVTPIAVTVGAAATGSLTAADRGFHELDLTGQDWLEFAVTPGGFASAQVRLYRRDAEGQLDLLVPAQVTAAAPFGRVVYGQSGTVLVSVEDAAGHDGDEAYELLVAPRDAIDAGTLTAAAPIALTGVAAPALVFLRVAPGTDVRVTATPGAANRDLVLDRLGRDEAAIATFDGAGNGGQEVAVLAAGEGWVALRVAEDSGQAASFDLTAEVVAP